MLRTIEILFSPDGKEAFIANTGADKGSVTDLGLWEVIDSYHTGSKPDGLGYIEVSVD